MAELRQLRFVAPPGAAQLIVVRHGETTPVRDGEPVALLGTQSDPELDPVGVAQAEAIGERLSSEEAIAAIYVTPMRRTLATAAPLASALGLTPREEPGLIEVHLGEWEGGELRRRVVARDPLARRMAAEERWDVIPGAEPAEALAARVRDAITRIAAAHPDETVVVVSHGGTIGQILAMATGSRPFAFTAADNGSISRLVVAGERWVVRAYNDVGHLD